MLSAGAYHRARGQLEEALDAYRRALMVAPNTDPAVLASIYAHIGAIKRQQGKPREAELNYEKALSTMPNHRRSLDSLVEMAAEEKDFARVVSWRRRIADLLTDPAEKADELARVGAVLCDELHDERAATETLETARTLRPTHDAVLRRLAQLYDRAGDGAKTVAVLEALVESSDVAVDDWPAILDAIGAARAKRNEWKELEALYTRLVDRAAAAGRADRAGDVCRRLGALRRDRLGDVEGAIDAFSGALRCRPSDVETRAEIAALFAASGDTRAALHELEVAAKFAPRRQATYRALFELHTREGRVDRAWLAAMALEQLQSADVDHEMMAKQYRSEGAIRPANALDDSAWDSFLRAPGWDPAVAEILRAVGPASAASRVDELRAHKRLLELDPARRQAPDSTPVVRSFAWAASVLGIALPEIYLLDDVPGGMAAVPAPTPTIAIGRQVMTDLSPQELAFLCARHLTTYRSEHYPLVFFPTLADLSVLFLAAVTVVEPDQPVPASSAQAIVRRRGELVARLDAEAKEALTDGVHAFQHAGGRADLGGYIRSVETSACRVGLVLCGDLSVAVRVLANEKRNVAELTADDRIDDLLVYCAHEPAAVLREWLGVAAHPSMRPPAVR
jgi:tetratricopeptide (TPR) repeat protein